MKLTDAITDLFHRHFEKPEYPIREYPKFLFKEGGLEIGGELKIDFRSMLLDCRDEILQLPEFIKCAEYMAKNPIIRRNFEVSDKDGKPVETVPLDIVLAGSLHPFLVTYLNKIGSLKFDEEVIIFRNQMSVF